MSQFVFSKPSSYEEGYTKEQKKEIHETRLRIRRIWLFDKLKKAKDDYSKSILQDCINELDEQIKG